MTPFELRMIAVWYSMPTPNTLFVQIVHLPLLNLFLVLMTALLVP